MECEPKNCPSTHIYNTLSLLKVSSAVKICSENPPCGTAVYTRNTTAVSAFVTADE